MTALFCSPSRLVALLAALLFFSACHSSGLTADERARQVAIRRDSAAGWLSMGEFQRAKDQAERGLELESDDFTLNLYLGRALLNIGTVPDILRAEQILLELPSDEDFRVPLSLGEVLERKGLAYGEAAERVRSGEQRTEALDPQARADELDEMGRQAFVQSKVEYQKAYDLEPGDTEILNGLVRICALLGHYEDALAWGEAIIRITRDDRLFWKQQIERPNISDREEERMWANIRELEALEIAVHLGSAAILNNHLDDPETALRHVEAIIEFDPSIPETYSRQAQLMIKLERFEEAIAAIDNYLKRTTLEYDHLDIQRAYRLRTDCEAALVRNDG